MEQMDYIIKMKVNNVRYLKKGILLIGCSFLLGGCGLRKSIDEFPIPLSQEIGQTTDNQTVSIAWMRGEDVESLDWERITQVYLEMSEEEAEEFLTPGFERLYEADLRMLSGGEFIKLCSIRYRDDREYACTCYEQMFDTLSSLEFDFAAQELVWRRNFPMESLDICTKEEAIEACRPYMELIGYGRLR